MLCELCKHYLVFSGEENRKAILTVPNSSKPALIEHQMVAIHQSGQFQAYTQMNEAWEEFLSLRKIVEKALLVYSLICAHVKFGHLGEESSYCPVVITCVLPCPSVMVAGWRLLHTDLRI